MSIFGFLRGTTSNIPKSSHTESDTGEALNCSPVTALRVGDLIDGALGRDLVVRVERSGDAVSVTTNAGRTDYHETDTVDALRRVKHPRTGDWHLVPVR